MKEVMRVNKCEFLDDTFVLYELMEEQEKEYGGKYFLSRCEVSKWVMHSCVCLDKFISKNKSDMSDCFFQTKTEAMLKINVIIMQNKIDCLVKVVKELSNTDTQSICSGAGFKLN